MGPKRPVARYHGGKWRLAPWIISHFPQHRVYCEPFGGAGSVLLRKPRAFAEIYNDRDDEIVNVFRTLREPAAAADLRARCEMTPFSRREFLLAYEPTDDPIEAVRRTLVRSWMGHGAAGVRARKTGFRVNPHRQRTTAAGDWAGWPVAIQSFTERLQGVVIEARPAAQVIASNDGAETLFYVDPPYMFETRSQKRMGNCLYHGYRHELTDEDHAALLDQLCGLSGMVVLSGYATDLYDRRLTGWQRLEKEARADRGVKRTEVLWLNPAAAQARQILRAAA